MHTSITSDEGERVDVARGKCIHGCQRESIYLSKSAFNSRIGILIDIETDSRFITDWQNSRVVGWSSNYDGKRGITLIDKTDCFGLVVDDQRYLYTSNDAKHEVRHYRLEDKWT